SRVSLTRGGLKPRATEGQVHLAGAADGGAFVDAAEWWAEHLVKRTIVGFMGDEGINQADDREAWVGSGIGYRGTATWSIPAEDLLGQAYPPTAVHTGD